MRNCNETILDRTTPHVLIAQKEILSLTIKPTVGEATTPGLWKRQLQPTRVSGQRHGRARTHFTEAGRSRLCLPKKEYAKLISLFK